MVDRLAVDYEIYVERNRSLRRLLRGSNRERQTRRIHAIKQVSMVATTGESVGVIGHNGSGKTTLLRAIGGLVPITAGQIKVRSNPVLLGVRAALISDLSARQNIFLGGTSLRIPRSELDARLDDIIEFAGLEEFVDVPLRAFSSGMRARLQFAIATAVTPDILMIDEALSVGDAEFKERSDARIKEMIADAGTVFLVSHSMRSVLDICDRVLWIDHGELVADGPAEEVVEAYQAHVERRRVARRKRQAKKAAAEQAAAEDSAAKPAPSDPGMSPADQPPVPPSDDTADPPQHAPDEPPSDPPPATP